MRIALLTLLLAASTQPTAAQSVEDRVAIIELADRLDTTVDAKDWQGARKVFAETITVELPGQAPSQMPSADLVGIWEQHLHADKASFHLRGNHLVTFDGADRAELVSKAYAWNRVEGLEGGDLWEVWGDYTYSAERGPQGWRLTSFRFEPRHERGNTAVPTHTPEG